MSSPPCFGGENHTLKRALTDPRLFDGIGNAYSDEILHAAGLSPLAQTKKLSDEQIQRLYAKTRETLRTWIDRLHAEFGERFPRAGRDHCVSAGLRCPWPLRKAVPRL